MRDLQSTVIYGTAMAQLTWRNNLENRTEPSSSPDMQDLHNTMIYGTTMAQLMLRNNFKYDVHTEFNFID